MSQKWQVQTNKKLNDDFFEFISFLTLKEEPDQMTMSLLVIGRKVTIEDQTSKKLVKTQRWFLWISNFFDVFGFVKNLSQKWYVCNTLFVWEKMEQIQTCKIHEYGTIISVDFLLFDYFEVLLKNLSQKWYLI